MESTLFAVTLVSLGTAVAMGVVTWRLLRAERRRSAARVEALAELATRDEGEPRRPTEPRSIGRPAATAESDPLDRPLQRTPLGLAPSAPPEPRIGLNGAGGELFAAGDVKDGQRRVLVFAAGIVLVAGVIAILLAFGQPSAGPEPIAAGRSAPLELLSLRHARQDETLTISGLVLNPANGRELIGIVAVASVFDQAGEFIGSGRTPLEFTRLSPGTESPFQITIANAGGVGRYRIGFRTDDGGVLGHVDRRGRAAAAPAEPTSTPERTSLPSATGNQR